MTDHLSLALEPMKRKQMSSANESYAFGEVKDDNLCQNVRKCDTSTRRVAHGHLLQGAVLHTVAAVHD